MSYRSKSGRDAFISQGENELMLSIIIPTYNEKENIGKLAERISQVLKQNNIESEMIVIDDNSPDGTGAAAEKLKDNYSIRVMHRPKRLGLASAVAAGFKIAKGDTLCVMDADLSHSPDEIPRMFELIQESRSDFVVGSRYVEGGFSKEWSWIRRLISSLACFLARGLTKIKDPTSGFFMIKREVVNNAGLKPIGFKICLEIIARGKYGAICEIPITFANRKHEKSKLGITEFFQYIIQLVELYSLKRPLSSQFVKYALVGLAGFFIQIVILYSLVEYFGAYYLFAAIAAFFMAVTSNFIFNKNWTFRANMNKNLCQQYVSFVALSVLGAAINTFILFVLVEHVHFWYLNAQCVSFVVVGIGNFLGARSIAFS